jgi:hypothetical protein
VGIEHLKALSRNDACWCDSGKKYKKCHLAADEAAAREEAGRPAISTTPEPTPLDFRMNKAAWITVAIALAGTAGVTFWRSFGDGLIAGLAVMIIGIGYLILRDPPPPNEVQGDPAGLNFGVPPNTETTTTAAQQPQQRYRGPGRRR